jgi:hypothetical protein
MLIAIEQTIELCQENINVTEKPFSFSNKSLDKDYIMRRLVK